MTVRPQDGEGSPVGTDRPPRRRRWVRILLIGGTLVVALGIWFAVSWRTDTARQVSIDTARNRLGSETTLAPRTGELRPAAGVYLYTGSGTDRLTTLSKEQSEGPRMPATVTHRPDGCWTFRIDYNSNHWQSWDYCPRSGGLEEAGGQTYQRWDFVVYVSESTSTFTCPSAVTIRERQSPGDRWHQRCHSTTEPVVTTTGPYTFVGPETLSIGGRRVDALHYRRERTMSGGQSGTERSEVWFSAADGLPLRNRRILEVDTDTVVGAVHYTEDARFELTDLSPRS